MGQLYQSLTRNQNLIPTVQNIQKYLDEKRKQENLKKFLGLLQSTRSGIEKTYDQGIVRGKNQPTTETWDTLPEQGPQNKVSTSQLIGPKTQQEANAPPPQPEIPMDEGVSVDVLGDYSSTPGQVADVNRKANRQLADYLYGIIATPNEDVSSEQKQLGMNMLSQIIKGEQPPEKKLKSFRPENTVFDEQGNVVQQGTPKEQKKTFKVSDDGYYLYWDDAQGWVNTGQKAEKKANADNSLGWVKYANELEQQKTKKEQTEKEAQTRYNEIMGSDFIAMEDLLAQGLIGEDDPSAKYNPKTKKYVQGGAYVVRDDKGKTKLIFDDKQLKDYADSQTKGVPNTWSREKKKTDDKDPLGIR